MNQYPRFKASGTGAVARNWRDKVREVVSVKDYGAVGDGSTDDTAAIQSAIDRLVANGGGCLYTPPGFYKTTSVLSITKGIIIQGAGLGVGTGSGNSGGTVIRNASASGDVFTISSAESVSIRDLAIDCPSFTKSSGTAGIRIQGAGGSGNVNNRTRLENVRISNMYDGVMFDAASNCVIQACHIQDFLNVGIYSKNTGGVDSGHNTINACVIWDLNVGTSQAGIRYDKGGDIRIVNNKILGGDYGLRIALDDGETGTLLITGNSFEEQLINDIRIGQATVSKNLGNVVICGNQFSIIAPTTPQSNIAVVAGTAGGGATSWVKNISITGNVFNNAHNAAYYAISVQDGEGVVVSSNVISGGGNANPGGIDVSGSTVSAKVVGNSIFDMPSNKYSPATTFFRQPSAVLTFSTGGATVPAGSTVYLTPGGYSTTEAQAFMYIPFAAMACNFMTHGQTGAGGVDTFTYRLRANGANTSIVATATGANSDAQDRTNTATIPSPAGPSTAARVSVMLTTSATAAAVAHTVSFQVVDNDL